MTKKRNSSKARITKEIELPDNVRAHLNDRFLVIEGPKGEVKRNIKQYNVLIKVDDKKIVLESKGGTKEEKKLLGSLVAHVKNMVKGSLQNHIYILKICSGHFPMSVSVIGGKFIVKNFLGEKVQRVLEIKQGADIRVEGDLIYVASTNKEIAGQVSADIEQLTRRPGYDTRIFQDGCYVISKDGKELK